MSRPLVTFFVINSFTTFIITYIYNYYNVFFNQKRQLSQNINTSKEDELEFIINKIKNLDQSIFLLQQTVDDLKETIEEKNNKVIESSTILNNKLEEFIHINYEVFN
jgi:hypothetical protein